MAPTIAAVLSFIPTNIWKMIKKFVKPEKTIAFDTPFKISTKYSPALFVIIMSLSFANQFFRNIEIDCIYSGTSEISQGSARGGYGGSSSADSDLNNFCWNYETFLVAKALNPKMRGKVTYPGIWSYVRGEDELIKQRYYKYLWFGLAKLAAVSFFPLFIWKLKGFASSIKSLTEVGNNLSDDETDVRRVEYFVESIGFNNSISYFYMFVKFVGCLTPVINFFYLTGFIGKLYRYYGIDVIIYTFDAEGDPWPSPMDALFPKIAKCEWSKYGYTGDLEIKAAQCQLPMNNFTQWSFFVLWWWLVFVFVANVPSMLYHIMMMLPFLRNYIYRKYVGRICRQDVERLRSHKIITTKKRKLTKIILCKTSFGDWFILDYIERNVIDYQFRSFMKKLVVTANPILQLRSPPEANLTAGEPGLMENQEKMNGVPMGFILNNEPLQPPKYESYDEASDGTLSTVACETPPNQPEPNAPPPPAPMGFMFPPLATAAAGAIPAKPTPRPKPGSETKKKDDVKKTKPPLKPKPKLSNNTVVLRNPSNNSMLGMAGMGMGLGMGNPSSNKSNPSNKKPHYMEDEELW